MQDHFKTRLEMIKWLNELPEADAVYLGNLNWVLYHNPLGDEAKKIENIRAEHEERLKQVEATCRGNFEKELEKTSQAKNREIENLELTIKRNNHEYNVIKSDYEQEKCKSKHLTDENQRLTAGITSQVQNISGILNRQFGSNQSSPQKGATGEAWFRQLLIDDPAITVLHVGNTFNQGDFVVTLKKSSVNTMIEVKNSKTNIYGEQREKFLRDLDSNDQYQCALLVSCHSGFDLATEEFKIYRSPKGNKPYCFLANLADRKNPEVILKIVLYMLQAFAEYSNAKSLDEKQFSCLVMSDIKAWQETLNRATKRVSDAKALANNLESDKTATISNFEGLKQKWDDLQNGRPGGANGGANGDAVVAEPPSKVFKRDLDTFF